MIQSGPVNMLWKIICLFHIDKLSTFVWICLKTVPVFKIWICTFYAIGVYML